jgi:hypothetical protein
MIPITPRYEGNSQHQLCRQGWVLPMVPMSVSFHRQQAAKRSTLTDYTSADEMCAANVLINLSPKEAPRHVRHPAQPSPYAAMPSHHRMYNQRWENYYHLNSSSSDFESSPDHGSESCEYSSEASVAESSYESAPSLRSDVAWCSGSVSLSLRGDDDALSPLHCFMRRYCVEAFSASPDDVSTPRYGQSHGVKVVVGQIAIRCLYCKNRPVGKRPERAVCYPSSLKNIYHSIETWQRRHSLVCGDIPSWVRKSIMELMESSKSRAGGRRQYWEDSAMRLGMVDTPHGVRFNRPPGDLGGPAQLPRRENFFSAPVVREEDRPLVTEYLFLLMEQMQTCKFTEEDRVGGRSKVKDNIVGFLGMQCKHCHGKAGFGRYFPSTVNALALANSDRNIYNHVQKCRRCPSHAKANLVRLFFQRVWERMHGISSKVV